MNDYLYVTKGYDISSGYLDSEWKRVGDWLISTVKSKYFEEGAMSGVLHVHDNREGFSCAWMEKKKTIFCMRCGTKMDEGILMLIRVKDTEGKL